MSECLLQLHLFSYCDKDLAISPNPLTELDMAKCLVGQLALVSMRKVFFDAPTVQDLTALTTSTSPEIVDTSECLLELKEVNVTLMCSSQTLKMVPLLEHILHFIP